MIAFFMWALFLSVVITALVHFLFKYWQGSYGKVVSINVLAALLTVFLSAFANADDGPLDFGAAPIYLLAQVIILTFDLVRTHGKMSKAAI